MDTAAALIPSKKRKRSRSKLNKPHLPTEIIEEILSNLPLKSLLRFSSVSKSWESMISHPVFARKHKNRAALLRRHRLVVYVHDDWSEAATFCDLAPISSDLRIKVDMKKHQPLPRDGSAPSIIFVSDSSAKTNVDATDYVGQFDGKPALIAYCDELWFVQVKESLFLWNPSMRNIVQLPFPSFGYNELYAFLYGLAYDSVNDDYKILKIERNPPYISELYSWNNKRWRKIESFSNVPIPDSKQERCEFVNGRFHWFTVTTEGVPSIASFDLSTEKYGEVAQPQYDFSFAEYEFSSIEDLEVIALRGMLCVLAVLKDTYTFKFVLWVMEEYGVEKSWTKRFDIPFSNINYMIPKPFYLSDNNDILVKFYDTPISDMYVVMYRNGGAEPMEIINCGDRMEYAGDALLFVESLITL